VKSETAENRKRRAPNAKRRTPNAERQAPNAERRTPSAERRTPSAERQAPNAFLSPPTSPERFRDRLDAIDVLLRKHPETQGGPQPNDYRGLQGYLGAGSHIASESYPFSKSAGRCRPRIP
jgi:hypothetical protein